MSGEIKERHIHALIVL